MAMTKDFGNTVVEQKKKKQQARKLTVLKESDDNTIFNLLFAEKKTEKDEQDS